jgi:hypothetical protein
MLKKYTKYVATAFAVASLSTFIIGCGGEADQQGDQNDMDPLEGADPEKEEGTGEEGTGDEGSNP